jgi:hypothetical protein
LDRGHPALSLVGYPRLAAHAHDHVVVLHAVDELLQRVWERLRIGIDLSTKVSSSSISSVHQADIAK